MISNEQVFHYNCRYGTAEGVMAMIAQMAENDSDSVAYFVNRRNSMRYTPLHTAIFARNLGTCKALLACGAVDVDLKCHGTPALHLVLNIAVLPDGKEFAMEIFSALLAQEKIDISARDDQMATALHIASEYNLVKCIKMLLAMPEGCDVDAKDRTGLRPIHRAASRDASDAAKLLIASGGAQISPQTPYGSTPLHIAAAYSSVKTWKVLVDAGADASGIIDCWNRSPADLIALNGWTFEDKKKSVIVPDAKKVICKLSAATAIISHSICRRHYTCEPSQTEDPSAPPENVKRLQVVIDEKDGSLCSEDIAKDLLWVRECKAATMGDVLRVHEWPYVRKIQGFCETIPSDPEGDNGIGSLDGDTTLCHDSFAAAMFAAGSVTQGVDMVCKGLARNTFAPVRPPGHHAGPKGLVKGKDGGPDSHGFCLLNNVSIGAAYALNVHRDVIKRVAIVDFDVHHGNGTEETIRWLKPGVEDIGLNESMCFGSLALPRYKPWFDQDDTNNVLFVSVHGYGPREKGLEHLMPQAAFYPGSGKTHVPDVTVPGGGGAQLGGPTGLPGPPHPLLKQQLSDLPFTAMKSRDDDEDGNGDEDNEDDDDDDDDHDAGDEDEGGQDEDEDEEMEMDESPDMGEFYMKEGDNEDDSEDDEGASSKLQQKIRKMRSLYTKTPHGVSSVRPPVPPLILDVGVPLPAHQDVTGGEYRHMWRNYFREHIFTSLMKFKPDLILISAGFDAHKKDTINGGYIALVEEDFEWVTTNLIRIANSSCNGRVVSVLEGGYQILGEHCSAFAKSVKSHVVSLASGAKTVTPYLQADSDAEAAVERKLLDEAAERRMQKLLLQQQREEAVREARRAAAAAEDADAATLMSAAPASEVPGSEDGSRKRRRAQVDYVALDKEINGGKASEPAVE